MILIHSASCFVARIVILMMTMTAVLHIHVGPERFMVYSFMIISPIATTTTKTATSSVSRINRHASLTTTKNMGTDEDNMDSAATTSTASKPQKIVIVSPPGGIGEVTAVKVAQQGYHVKWLVIRSSPESDNNNYNNRMNEPAESVVTISQEILNDIGSVGGSIQLAGADTTDLMSSIDAITTWCDQANVIVSTVDGVDQGDILTRDSRKRLTEKDENENDTRNEWKKAIYVATRAVATNTKASTKIAILSAADMEDTKSDDNDNNNNSLLSPLTNLFKSGGGGDNMNIPTSLSDALTVSNNNNNNAEQDQIIKLRHGAVLFGLPETSPDFTPLINGPRKIPEFCPEYSNRQIRIDPTYNVLSGTNMFRSMSTTSMDTTMSSRTSRHSMGDAVVTLLNMIHGNKNDVFAPLESADGRSILDICVTSQPGTDIVTPDEWNNELQRVITTLSSSGDALSSLSNTASSGMQLFQVEFGSVPNVDRLTDWMTTKWAPAILRTYDIAAIRTGPRPVYANRIALDDPNDTGKLEIVWQQLINFEPVIIGRMMIEITNSGMKASRIVQVGSGALAGEDILVRRLAEAASQAIEKGLATKVGICIVCICFTIIYVNIL